MWDNALLRPLVAVVLVGLVALPAAWATPPATRAPVPRRPGPSPSATPELPVWDLPHDGPGYDGGCGLRGPRRCLAFTFDDGPDCHTTPAVLETLRRHRLRATFFVVGHRLDGDDPYHARNREVLREIVRDGHRVGNHTYQHVVLDGLRPERLAWEIDRTEALIRGVTGQRPSLLRAPFGALSTRRAVEAVHLRGYTHVHWDVDTMDWSVASADAVTQNFRQVLAYHPRGGVVLLHDTHPWSVRAFPQLLAYLSQTNRQARARGERPWELVGVEEFLPRPEDPTTPAPRGQPAAAGAPSPRGAAGRSPPGR
ncbi:MAG: polysaccharide deacetylase family protein [Deltaproteobacteria bacterium]|nr:polysaccharide deacetylase family protein [Deltaproteobacteria bacterium]